MQNLPGNPQVFKFSSVLTTFFDSCVHISGFIANRNFEQIIQCSLNVATLAKLKRPRTRMKGQQTGKVELVYVQGADERNGRCVGRRCRCGNRKWRTGGDGRN